MRDRIGAYVKYPRFRAVVLDAFAAMALLLAVIGLHGLLAQYVTERTQELAVRMAVGAQARDIIWLVAKQASVPVIAGLLIGLALTAGVSRYLVSLLFEIRPLDPPTIAGACLALIGAASLATLKSAIRAISLDPIAALREE